MLPNRSWLVHLSVSTLMLFLMLRTWLVMGLIEPVTVSGSSMAPTLRGAHIAVQCERCGHEFDIGADFQAAEAECLRCGYAQNSIEGFPIERGDSLVVDRTAFELRAPRRWEVVVLRSPEDGQLAVKRIVGLPGETVQLRGGDVWVDGEVATKSLNEMRALRQLIHEEADNAKRWRASDEVACRWHSGAWHIAAQDGAERGLVYVHPEGAAITNDTAYNAKLTRRLFPVRDFALSAIIRSPGDWHIALEFDIGGESLSLSIEDSGDALMEVFAFDRRVQILLDGRLHEEIELEQAAIESRSDNPSPSPSPPVILSCDRGGGFRSKPTARPFFLGVQQSYVELSDLRIYHDIYYASEAEQVGSPRPMQSVKVGPQEIYVLGDNEPVSIDSRRWGPVPLRLLVGKPLGVR
jgi:signal peptidase I